LRLGDAALEQAIKEGKGVMPAWGRDREGPFSDDEVHLVIDYLKASARSGEEGTVPEEAAALSSPVAGSPSPEVGRRLFANNCATCHGQNGSRIPAADLSSKAFIDALDDETLATTIADGKGGMPGFSVAKEGPLTESDIRSIVAFLRTLGQQEAAPEGSAGQPSQETGRQLFSENCVGCHGEAGTRIASVDLSSKDFLDALDDAELTQVIAQGRAGMPGFGSAAGGSLADSDIQSIVLFLRSLAGGP
jgi:mono/diheme cytochrome c family protein